MNILYLYLWYAVAVVIAFIILWHRSLGGMPPGVAFLTATIFGLVIALILIPNYKKPNMTEDEQQWLTGFMILTVALPVVALIWVFVGQEYKQYWYKGTKAERSGSCFVESSIACDSQSGNCVPVGIDEKCKDSATHIRFF